MVAMRASKELGSSVPLAPLVREELGKQEHCCTWLGAASRAVATKLIDKAAACAPKHIDQDWLSLWACTGKVWNR